MWRLARSTRARWRGWRRDWRRRAQSMPARLLTWKRGRSGPQRSRGRGGRSAGSWRGGWRRCRRARRSRNPGPCPAATDGQRPAREGAWTRLLSLLVSSMPTSLLIAALFLLLVGLAAAFAPTGRAPSTTHLHQNLTASLFLLLVGLAAAFAPAGRAPSTTHLHQNSNQKPFDNSVSLQFERRRPPRLIPTRPTTPSSARS